MAIDLHELPGERFAFRFYDGDDRRIVVWSSTRRGRSSRSTGPTSPSGSANSYYETGALAFDPEAMVHFLRKKSGRRDGPGSNRC